MKKEVIIEVEEETTQVRSSTQNIEEPEGGQQKKTDQDDQLKFQMHNLEDVAEINEDDVVNTFNEDANQEETNFLLEKEQTPTEVHEERREIPVLDKLRVDNTQSSKEGFEEKLVMQGVKREFFHLAAIKHQGKTLSMLGEVGVGWRPKTRPKNKLRLNMKKNLNPKLAQEKITILEYSCSQEDLEEDEILNVKKVKSKKKDSLMVNSSLVQIKIPEQFEDFKKKENLFP